jgi:branched-chain amino acid transport system permease protein
MNRVATTYRRLTSFRGTTWAIGLVAFAVLFLLPNLFGALDLNRANLVQVASSAAISGILVLSLNLAMGYGGMMSLAHTALLAIGGYATGILAVHYGVDLWLGIIAAVVVTALASALLTVVTLRATDLYFGLITLSFSLLVVAVAQQWRSQTGGFNGLILSKRVTFGGSPLSDEQFYYVILVALGVSYLFQRNVILSPMGRRFQAIKDSPETAASLGFNPRSGRLLVFTLSGGIAGLAGALYVQQLNFISPDSGSLNTTLPLFIALFVGGIATLIGPLLGVVAITVVSELLRDQGQIAQVVLGAILLVAMFVIPEGFVGTWSRSRFAIESRSPGVARRELKRNRAVAVDQSVTGAVIGAADSSVAVLHAVGLTKDFGGLRALSNASITVTRAQIHGLIGPNGAGKSTLVNCVTGVYRADSGTVTIEGNPANVSQHRVARSGMCRVFQVPHTLDHLSILDNVMVGLDGDRPLSFIGSIFRLPRFRTDEVAYRQRAWTLLERFGLAESANLPASVLSHGQRRLLEVARAVARNPRILVLDEPATGLTRSELMAMSTLLRELRDTGVSILLIEHNMEFVVSLCSQITVMSMGAVIACGTADEVMSNEFVRAVYLGGDLAVVSDPGRIVVDSKAAK